jgi:RNA polymerase sigma-70 factor (ECF subfamily)
LEVEFKNIHQDIVDQCKAGSRSAHKQLYDLYSKAMFNTCLRITNDRYEAEDVLQEAFVSAFKNIHSYRGDSTFGAWLKRIVVNRAINHMKKKRLDLVSIDDQGDRQFNGNHYDLEIEGRTDEENLKRVKTAVKMLPDGYRTVLSLYLMEGYDHAEIAEIMNITESTSKSQFNRAKKKLKLILEEL